MMKLTNLIKFTTIAAFSYLAFSPASAIETSVKREIYNIHKDSVYGIKGILKITATLNGEAKNQEAQIWSNATCISDGLLVAAYSSINPNVGGNIPNVEITKKLESLKIINAAGEAFDAKLVLHDEDLGLAFIALDPRAANANNWKSNIVDISKDIKLQHLDETINIFRYQDHLHFQSAVMLGSVTAILEKPRKLYQIMNTALSSPSFNHAGEFVGITVAMTPIENKPSPAVTIPAKYIRNLLELAKTKQAEHR